MDLYEPQYLLTHVNFKDLDVKYSHAFAYFVSISLNKVCCLFAVCLLTVRCRSLGRLPVEEAG